VASVVRIYRLNGRMFMVYNLVSNLVWTARNLAAASVTLFRAIKAGMP